MLRKRGDGGGASFIFRLSTHFYLKNRAYSKESMCFGYPCIYVSCTQEHDLCTETNTCVSLAAHLHPWTYVFACTYA